MKREQLNKIAEELEKIESLMGKKADSSRGIQDSDVLDKAAERLVGVLSEEISKTLKFWKKNPTLLERYIDVDNAPHYLLNYVEAEFEKKMAVWRKLWRGKEFPKQAKVASLTPAEVKLAKDLLNQAVRELQGSRADFIQVIYHDGKFKLNDVGEIAIPSRSIGSITVEKDPSTGKVDKAWYLDEIKDFMSRILAAEERQKDYDPLDDFNYPGSRHHY